jgi:hypothetical protein
MPGVRKAVARVYAESLSEHVRTFWDISSSFLGFEAGGRNGTRDTS